MAAPSDEPTPQKDSVIEEASKIFQDQLAETIDIPTFRTTEAINGSHFRFNFDNLLSTLTNVHQEHFDGNYQRQHRGKTVIASELATARATDANAKLLRRCYNFAVKVDDDRLASIFYELCMSSDSKVACPKVAWWTGSTNDWISRLNPSQLSFVPLFNKVPGAVPPPFIPIAAVYDEAVEMRTRCEEVDSAVESDQCVFPLKIAKHLYLCFLEAIRHHKRDKLSAGDKARIKQCERRLKVIYTSLEEAVGEDEDFLDVLISSIPGLKGPDGQELNSKAVRRALGSVMKTNTIHELMTLIPKILSTASDEKSARTELMKQPLIQELMNTSKGQQNLDQVMGFFGGIGALPTSDTSSIPLNVNTKSLPKKSGSIKK